MPWRDLEDADDVSGLREIGISLLLCAGLAACASPVGDLPQSVTYYEHIEPIVYEHCSSCHRRGESGPFPLVTYDHVERRARQISEVTQSGYMPPWVPSGGDFAFVGERRLAVREIELIRRWVKQGAVEGDRAQHRPSPQWIEGWQLGEPDLVVEMDVPYVLPADSVDVFANFVMPIPVDRSRWVRAVELRPGNKRVVHHAIMCIDRTGSSRRRDAEDAGPGFGGMEMGDAVPPGGQFLGWTPGRVPVDDSSTAWRLEPGTDLVLQLHLLPSGKPEPIQATVGLYFSDVAPTIRPMIVSLDDGTIDIPAGDHDYLAEDAIELSVPVEVMTIYPHAHYRGKNMTITAEHAQQGVKTLLQVDDWDFNWQDEYRYETPVKLPAGTTIRMRYRFDNSASNERNPVVPPVRVFGGDRSTDEMATLTLQVLTRNEDERHRLEDAQSHHTLEKTGANDTQSRRRRGTAHNNLGSNLLTQGDHAAAIEHFSQAIRLHPQMEQAHYNLGLALDTAGRSEEALEAYRAALEINDLFAAAENNLGTVLLGLGRTAEALQHYRRAVELGSDDGNAHSNLCVALLKLGRPAEAERELRNALAADPSDSTKLAILAEVVLASGRRDEAKQLLKQALELDPTLIPARLRLSRLLAAEGDRVAAKEHLQIILEIDAGHSGARAALAALER